MTSPVSPRPGHSGARYTDDELLDAARTAFLRDGFDAATMQAIAERAGTTKPTLYARHGDKTGLAINCAEREIARIKSFLDVAYADAQDLPIRAQVQAGLQAIVDYHHQNVEGFAFLTQVEWPEKFHMIEDLQKALSSRIEDSIRVNLTRRGLSLGPAGPDVADLAIAVGWRTAVSVSSSGPQRAKTLVDVATTLVYGGLEALGSRLGSP